MDYLQGRQRDENLRRHDRRPRLLPAFSGRDCRRLFGDISNDIRHQYTISYSPTNSKLDGTYRKLKVQIVAPGGGPLKVKDQKGKNVKIEVVARDGYTAKHTVD